MLTAVSVRFVGTWRGAGTPLINPHSLNKAYCECKNQKLLYSKQKCGELLSLLLPRTPEGLGCGAAGVSLDMREGGEVL